MSTNTLVFGLFEYDPETDGNLPFSISQALNNNWNKIDSLVPLLSTIAAPYNPSQSYSVGAYCTYQGNLQRCNTNIPTGEEWNPSHWDAVTIMSQTVNSGQINQPNGVAGLNEQSQISSSVIPPLNYDPAGSANSVQQNLTNHINNTNNPHQVTPQQIGALLAISAASAYNPSGTYAVGDYCTNEGELYKCNTAIPSGESWNPAHWTLTTVAAELDGKANATPAEKIPLPLVSGVNKWFCATIYKTQEDMVTINAWLKLDSPLNPNTETVLAILPKLCRPSEPISTAAFADNGANLSGTVARVNINPEGNVIALCPESLSFFAFVITYGVGGNATV